MGAAGVVQVTFAYGHDPCDDPIGGGWAADTAATDGDCVTEQPRVR